MTCANSPYSPELAVACSEHIFSAGNLAAMSNGTSTVSKSLPPGSETDTSPSRPSSLTCVSSFSPVQPDSTEALLTWLAGAFHVSHSAQQLEDETMPKTFGRGCFGSYPKPSLVSSSPRTSPVPGKYGMASDGTLRSTATPFADRFVSDRPTWAGPILVHGTGYLPRPTRTANQLAPSMMKHPGCRNLSALATGGELTPALWEWQMGWPIGWTDLQPLATDKFQQWQQQHGQLFDNATRTPKEQKK